MKSLAPWMLMAQVPQTYFYPLQDGNKATRMYQLTHLKPYQIQSLPLITPYVCNLPPPIETLPP